MKITLYKKDVTGAFRVWEAEAEYDADAYVIRHGIYGGAIQTKWVNVSTNHSGRSIYEQIDLEILSDANKKMDAGYCDTIEKAEANEAKNMLALPRPMLAQPLNKNMRFDSTAMVQYKYDGNRCLIHNYGDRLVAYSRNGKEITTINHILRQLDFPVGHTLDGELYHHGSSLQQIMSWTKRAQNDTLKLKYVVFDVIDKRPFTDRMYLLNHWDLPDVAPTNRLSVIPLMDQFHEARNLGYEGLIIRTGSSGYEAGKRSKSLVKVKQCLDDWFPIVDVIASKDGWGIFECKAKNGNTFKVNAIGGIAERKHYLEHKNRYVGKQVRVEYANLTADGIPFHPVAVAIG